MQRKLDIVLSFVAIAFLFPALLPLMILLRLTGEGEVFYLQERIGVNGQRFKLYKLATMLKASPNLGTGTMTVKDDPRILPVGRILRKTKINEIPQLFNVLIGEMSLIGPRPLTPETHSVYDSRIKGLISRVRPGLSGIGSIIFRDEEAILSGCRSHAAFYEETIAPYKGEIEEWYVENQGLITYFMAIALTIWIVLFSKSTVPWKVFKGLPKPPSELRHLLNYPN